MGNKWSENGVDRINPREFPYLHIVRYDGQWMYVPSVSTTANIELYMGDPSNVGSSSPLETFTIKLLEEPNGVIPPPEIVVAEHMTTNVKPSIGALDLAGRLRSHNGKVAVISVTHGRLWGWKIEDLIREELEKHGFKVQNSVGYSKVGGRNRIQAHGIFPIGRYF